MKLGKTRRHQKIQAPTILFIPGITGFLIISILTAVLFLHKPADSGQIRALPIPEIAAVSMPDPLMLPEISRSVLGAATFDAIDIAYAVTVLLLRYMTV